MNSTPVLPRIRASEPADPVYTTVMVVDDHPIFRQGMRSLIERHTAYQICAETDNAPEALSLAVKHAPHLAIVDITLPSTNGLELTKNLCALCPDLKILVVSMHDEEVYAERALRAGAKGFLCKEAASDHLAKALEVIYKGGVFLSSSQQQNLALTRNAARSTSRGIRTSALSDREVEVLALLGDGLSTREVAEQLKLSVKTVDTYRGNLKRKLALPDGNSLVHYAIQWAKCQEVG